MRSLLKRFVILLRQSEADKRFQLSEDICSTNSAYDIMPDTGFVCFHSDEQTMPRISQFFGIIIAMYYNDHAPPHFHARYGEYEALLSIESLSVIEGAVPGRALAMVLEWASLHRSELRGNWERARRGLPLEAIEPLT